MRQRAHGIFAVTVLTGRGGVLLGIGTQKFELVVALAAEVPVDRHSFPYPNDDLAVL